MFRFVQSGLIDLKNVTAVSLYPLLACYPRSLLGLLHSRCFQCSVFQVADCTRWLIFVRGSSALNPSSTAMEMPR